MIACSVSSLAAGITIKPIGQGRHLPSTLLRLTAFTQTSPPGPLSRGERGRQPGHRERVTVPPFPPGRGIGGRSVRREMITRVHASCQIGGRVMPLWHYRNNDMSFWHISPGKLPLLHRSGDLTRPVDFP